MIYVKRFCFAVFLLLFLAGCYGMKADGSLDTTDTSERFITVGDAIFTIDRLQEEIKQTINNHLYYHGHNEKSEYLMFNSALILHRALEYDLYYVPNSYTSAESAFVFPGKVYIVITNMQYDLLPIAGEQYVFGIDVTEWGLRSDFSYQGHMQQGEYSFLQEPTVSLGHYTLCLDEITPPVHEKMDASWEESAEKAIRLYMEQSDIFAEGKYHAYIQGFSKSDKDAVVIFENEKGDIYVGHYYSIHDIQQGVPANLNKVERIDYSKEQPFVTYFKRVCLQPTLKIQVTVGG